MAQANVDYLRSLGSDDESDLVIGEDSRYESALKKAKHKKKEEAEELPKINSKLSLLRMEKVRSNER